MTGTNTSPLGDAPPAGRPIDVRGADFLTLSQNEITEVREYFDASLMGRQLAGDA